MFKYNVPYNTSIVNLKSSVWDKFCEHYALLFNFNFTQHNNRNLIINCNVFFFCVCINVYNAFGSHWTNEFYLIIKKMSLITNKQ